MATLADRVLRALVDAGRPLDDDQLAAMLGVKRQAINQACRKLETEGRLARRVSVGSKIQNCIIGSPTQTLSRRAKTTPATPTGLVKEDEVKAAVRDYLTAHGYEVVVAWGHERGIDIEARRGDKRIVIEAKGKASLQPQQANYFLGGLGELLQRLDDPDALYGLALPDNRQYRGLVDRLPALVRERLNLVVFFVRRSDQGLVVSPE